MHTMYWLMGATILFGMAILLRRLLGLGTTVVRRPPVLLDHEQRSFCDQLAKEVESRLGILAVLLNDAIEELSAEHSLNTTHLLELAESEWISLAEFLTVILRNIADNLPVARIAIPVRSMAPSHFRSDVMIDYFRLHELVDQFLFHTKLRFHLQIRILRQAVDLLTSDFRRLDTRRRLNPSFSQALWNRLDRDYYDFDLIAKRTVLAFGKFVGWLPESAAADLVLSLRQLLDRDVRSSARSRSGGASYR